MKKQFILPLLIFVVACSSSKQSFVQLQSKELYDVANEVDSTSINGFKNTLIYADDLSNEIWVSPEKQCVTMEKNSEVVFSGDASLHVKWDKVTNGCKWIGLGFGWSNWQPKDMNEVIAESAIQMKVKSAKGSFSNLPVAFAIEDYTGVQSYYGYNSTLSSGNFNEQTWTTVSIPLKNFPFERNDADLGKVKQFMIQLEGDGDIYLDDIRIVSLIK
ncbi:MAG: hypothetical protein RLZZ94_766 [Bacteroidota bacterium]